MLPLLLTLFMRYELKVLFIPALAVILAVAQAIPPAQLLKVRGRGCIIDSLRAPLILLTMWITILMPLSNWYAPRKRGLFSRLIIMLLALFLRFSAQSMLLFYFFF